MIDCRYPEGLDYSWAAADKYGNIGIFTTGGWGPIPELFLNGPLALMEDVEAEILKLPVTSDFDLLVEMPRPDDFISFAARGIFAYDWRDVHRAIVDFTKMYEPIAIPKKPILVEQLNGPLRLFLSDIILNEIAFSERRNVDIVGVLQCAFP